jgi:6-phosphogluconolactonase (cycloisomerase 2 family)
MVVAASLAVAAGARESRIHPIQTLFNGNGLGAVRAIVATANGRHVYAAGNSDQSLVAFSRDVARGRLSQIAIYREGARGFRGIAAITGMALAADERFLYAVGGGTVTVLRRDAASGELTFEQSLQGTFGVAELFDIAIAADGETLYAAGANALALFAIEESGRVTHLTTIFDSPATDGLSGHTAVAVISDGKNVYVASDFDRSVAVFAVQPDSLAPVQILKASDAPGLGALADLLVAPDGGHVYAAVASGDRIAVFQRDPVDGRLSPAGSVADTPPGRGLAGPSRLAMSADGRRLYVVSSLHATVALLTRDPASGELTFVRFRADGTDGVVGIGGAAGLALGPAESHVYVSGPQDDSIGLFDAALSFLAVERNSAGAITGLRRPAALAISPDGAHLYTAGFESGTLDIFRREADGRLSFVDSYRGEGDLRLQQPIAVATSTDGAVVAVADFGAGSVQLLRRDSDSGGLSVAASVGSDEVPDLRGVAALAVDPGGAIVAAVSVLNGSAILLDVGPDAATLSLRGTMPALSEPSAAAFSHDGIFLYTASSGADAVRVFERSPSGPFGEIQTLRESDPDVRDMLSPTSLAASPDDRHIYVASGSSIFQLDGSNSVSELVHDDGDGSLVQVQVVIDQEDGVEGLAGAGAVAVAPDGSTVAVAGFSGNSLAVFERDAADGSLSFLEHHFDGIDGADGLRGASAVAFSPTGDEIYVTGFADNAISVFRVERPRPACPGDCDDSGSPGISELVRCVNIALGSTAVGACPACDVDGNGQVAINELIQAVNAALSGCPPDRESGVGSRD